MPLLAKPSPISSLQRAPFPFLPWLLPVLRIEAWVSPSQVGPYGSSFDDCVHLTFSGFSGPPVLLSQSCLRSCKVGMLGTCPSPRQKEESLGTIGTSGLFPLFLGPPYHHLYRLSVPLRFTSQFHPSSCFFVLPALSLTLPLLQIP